MKKITIIKNFVLKKATIAEVISLLYVSLMLYAGISKLTTFELSREQLSMMPLMAVIGDTVAWLLPVIEIVIAVLIFIPKTRLGGLMVGTGLMLFFTGYVFYIMTYQSTLPCTCGGFLQKLTWSQHLIFNSIFVLLGSIALIMGRRSSSRIENSSLKLT